MNDGSSKHAAPEKTLGPFDPGAEFENLNRKGTAEDATLAEAKTAAAAFGGVKRGPAYSSIVSHGTVQPPPETTTLADYRGGVLEQKPKND